MTTFKKLTRRDFARAIKRGHGRAVLHVSKYGDDGIEDVIKNAVLTNYAYDVQIEGLRPLWIWQILTLTGRPHFYADHLLQNFSLPSHQHNDTAQQFGLAGLFFDLGRQDFREVMFANFHKMAAHPRMSYCGISIVDVSGLAGLELVARTCGKSPDLLSEWDCAEVLEHACENGYEADIMDHMSSLAKQEPSVKAFMDVCAEFKSRDLKVANQQSRPQPTLEELIEPLQQGSTHNKPYFKFKSFGRRATQEELIRVRELLKQSTDEHDRIAFLSVFSWVAMPDIASDVINLLDNKNYRIRYLAAQAISHTKSKEVRDIALRLLRSGKGSCIPLALKLLENNYVVEDSFEINRALKSLRSDNHIHSAGMEIKDICNKSGGVELESTILWLYENGPDSFCRGEFIEKLVEWQRCPDEILFEAQWDVGSDVQNFARSKLAQRSE